MTVLAAFLLLAAGTARAADPFYTRLLREGTDAYNRQDYSTAVQKLRVACFGFLDEPAVLADGLTRLALAQAAAGDTAAFAATFERIADVEDRFKGYSRASTPPDVRAEFERLVLQLIPRATLAERPAFARLIPSAADRFAKLTPAQRRKELERMAKAEPKAVAWPLMLAELNLSQGNAKAAVTAAEQALKIEPGNQRALGLRGIALADQRRWPEAHEDLSRSGAVGTDRRATEADLQSLVELARFGEAAALVGRLPQDLAGDPAISRLGRVAAVGVEQARGTPTPVPSPTPTATPPATPTATPTATATRPATPTPLPTGTPARPPTPTAVPAGAPTKLAQPAPSPAPPRSAPAAAPPAVSTEAKAASAAALAVSAGAMASKEPAAVRTPTAPEQAELDRIRDLVARSQLDEAMARATRLADAQPDLAAVQFMAAEIAYRKSHWAEAVAYFHRGGDPGDARPGLLFYNSVSLYETGDRNGAASLLRRALPNLKRTPFVNEYVLKILGPDATPAARP